LRKQFEEGAILFCEGVGEGIQKVGKYFGKQHIKLLDIKIDNFWLEKENVKDVAEMLNLHYAPIRFLGTIQEAINFVKENHNSYFNENLKIEGLVGQPKGRLKNAKGERIQVKIKWVDFKRDIK